MQSKCQTTALASELHCLHSLHPKKERHKDSLMHTGTVHKIVVQSTVGGSGSTVNRQLVG